MLTNDGSGSQTAWSRNRRGGRPCFKMFGDSGGKPGATGSCSLEAAMILMDTHSLTYSASELEWSKCALSQGHLCIAFPVAWASHSMTMAVRAYGEWQLPGSRMEGLFWLITESQRGSLSLHSIGYKKVSSDSRKGDIEVASEYWQWWSVFHSQLAGKLNQ